MISAGFGTVRIEPNFRPDCVATLEPHGNRSFDERVKLPMPGQRDGMVCAYAVKPSTTVVLCNKLEFKQC